MVFSKETMDELKKAGRIKPYDPVASYEKELFDLSVEEGRLYSINPFSSLGFVESRLRLAIAGIQDRGQFLGPLRRFVIYIRDDGAALVVERTA